MSLNLVIKKGFLFVLVLSLSATTELFSQSVTPGVANSSGGTININGNTYEWSIGEMALVESMLVSDLNLTNGLLQPQKLAPVLAEAFNIVPRNILSPNGDGENDTWIIEHLSDFTENEVLVYDRAGRLVFQAKNYQNNWTGKLNNIALTEDTYMYVIRVKKGEQIGVKKGFLTIIR